VAATAALRVKVAVWVGMEALEVAVPGVNQHRVVVVTSELKGITVVLAVLPDNPII
jgi:hypothetical protein